MFEIKVLLVKPEVTRWCLYLVDFWLFKSLLCRNHFVWHNAQKNLNTMLMFTTAVHNWSKGKNIKRTCLETIFWTESDHNRCFFNNCSCNSALQLPWLVPGHLLILVAHDKILLPNGERRTQAGWGIVECLRVFGNVDQGRLQHLLHIHDCCGLQAAIPHLPHPRPNHWGRHQSKGTIKW